MAVPSLEQIQEWADHKCSEYGTPPCETATGHHDTRRRLAGLLLVAIDERRRLTEKIEHLERLADERIELIRKLNVTRALLEDARHRDCCDG